MVTLEGKAHHHTGELGLPPWHWVSVNIYGGQVDTVMCYLDPL